MDDRLDRMISRRAILRQGACASLGLAGLASQLFTLRTVQAALTSTSLTGYKAAVCIFLFGGNDNANTVIPWSGGDENWIDYANQREALTLTQPQLSSTVINPTNTSGRTFALHPELSYVAHLFEARNISLVANVGSLIEPLNRAEYRNKTKRFPPQLFSHNDQQDQWQFSTADAVDRLGWGGRVADSLQAAGVNQGSPVSMGISLAGTNFFLSGRNVTPFISGNTGAKTLDAAFGNSTDKAITNQAYADLIAAHRNPNFAGRDLLRRAYADIAQQAITGADAVNAAFAAPTNITIPTPDNNLSKQLAAVATLIEQAQSTLGHTRQIFFVAIGGFDNHDGLIGTNATDGAHAARLNEVNSGLKYFWDALGQIGMRNNVTTFTASDFGRTRASNGDGSDHGWGAEHIVMGGSQLAGKQMFGTYPSIVMGTNDDSGNSGRIIPTTSVDAYSFEIAKWLGVPLSEMTTIFPNLTRFLDPQSPATQLQILS